MARIVQEKIVLTISKMVKDSDEDTSVLTQEIITSLDTAMGHIGDNYNVMIEIGLE